MTKRLIIRADASAEIGTGHVFRCLALAQAWQDGGGEVTFATATIPEPLRERLESEKCAVHHVGAEAASDEDARITAHLARSLNASWVVLDGYGFGVNYRAVVKSIGLRVLLLDDDGRWGPYEVDAVLNQNLGADASLYSAAPAGTRLLLGSHLSMLRREFRCDLPTRGAAPENVVRLLVSFGGADPVNLSARVIEVFKEDPQLKLNVRLLVGLANPRLAKLRESAAADPRIEIVTATDNMPAMLNWADIALVAAGSTCWELCRLGVPALLIAVAENQRPIARALQQVGAARDLGWHEDVTSEAIRAALGDLASDAAARVSMGRAGRSAVDGRGAVRVASYLYWRERTDEDKLRVAVVVDNPRSWFQPYAKELCQRLESMAEVRMLGSAEDIPEQNDIAFLLSYERKVPSTLLNRSRHNIVVHASALPQGRGMSPLTWQILNGSDEIPLSLFEAVEAIDAGAIYLQELIWYRGTELVDELQAVLGNRIVELCEQFLLRFPESVASGRAQLGSGSVYPRRTPEDSRLDPEKSLGEQFNLLRVVDNERYPAFFDWRGRRYELRITART